MLRTLPTIALQVGVVLALVAGTTAFVALDKRVTIAVDGHQQQVRSFARNVGDLLDSEHVPYDLAHDLVTPAPSSSLADGETVQVRYGRPVLLTVDGETRTVWTTGRTVSQALMLLGVRSDGAYVSASRSRRIGRGGMALDVRMPHHLTFLADGTRHEVTTTATTVRSAMAEAGVALREQDRVSADLSAVPYAEQVVGLTRVDGKKAVEERPIKFDTVKRKSNDLYQGTTKIVKQGKVGIEVRTFRETYLDGKLDSRQLVSTPGHREAGDRGAAGRHQEDAGQRTGRRRPQLGRAGQLRVGRQPPGLQLGRPLLRALPVHGEHLARRGRRGRADRCQLVRADLPGADPLQPQRCRAVAGLRPLPVQLTVTAGDDAPALLGPVEVRELAARLGIRPTKTLGQNFVIDPNTVRRIVRTAELRADDHVVEVGPGLGSLTLALLPEVASVTAVEIDGLLAGAAARRPSRPAPRRTPVASRSSPPTRCGWTPSRASRPPRWWRTCPTTCRCRCCSRCSSGSRPSAGCW